MDRKQILESGLLELYAMGNLQGEELLLVDDALSNDEVLSDELRQIEQTLFLLAQANAIVPNPAVKLLLMAKVNYLQRLNQGETTAQLPLLHENSKIDEFQQWLMRADMQAPAHFDEGHVSIISHEADKMTAIVWLKYGSPPETHTSEYETFLIVEGTCDITIGTNVHHLQGGDYLSIPLFISHHVEVTSYIPCKIILQRVAA